MTTIGETPVVIDKAESPIYDPEGMTRVDALCSKGDVRFLNYPVAKFFARVGAQVSEHSIMCDGILTVEKVIK